MTTTTETSSIVCYNVSWEDSFYLSAELAVKIKESEYVPDVIIAISRGGLVPARVVADFMLERNLLCLRAEHWGVGTKHKKVKITGSTTNLESKRVLVVDDVADSGGTLFEMVKYLKERGAASVVTAAIRWYDCTEWRCAGASAINLGYKSFLYVLQVSFAIFFQV